MTKLCILSDILSNDTIITSSFKDDCIVKYYDYTDISAVFQDVDYSSITHLAFFYHFPGYYQVPFLDEEYEQLEDESGNIINPEQVPYNYKYFGDKLIDKVKEISDASSNTLIIDLVCCNLNYIDFKNEVERFESEYNVNIRYSIDNTGNNPDGNWVLESDNVNIKDLYFTSDIDAWTGVLTTALDISDNSLFNNTTYFDKDSVNKTVTLLKDITWETIREGYVSGSVTDFINMKPGWTFDGSGHTITINSTSGIYFQGLFAIDNVTVTNMNDAPLIKNISFDSNSVSLINQTSFCIRYQQKYFKLENCHTLSTCIINGSNCGGLVGQNARDFVLLNCTNSGNITGTYSGGLVGNKVCRNFSGNHMTCEIYNCENHGNMNQNYCGGIIGGNENGNEHNTNTSCIIKIINCKNYGIMNNKRNGGIIGGYSSGINSYNNTYMVNNCKNYGNIENAAELSSGIIGYLYYPATYYNNTNFFYITNCGNYGNLSGNACAGISSNIGNKNTYITNCFNLGNINNNSSSGIVYFFPQGMVESCYHIGGVTGSGSNAYKAGIVGRCCREHANAPAGVFREIVIKNCFAINTTYTTGIEIAGIATFVDDHIHDSPVLISNCYVYNFDHIMDYKNDPIKDTSIVITNCYSNRDIIFKNFISGGSNKVAVNNCYSNNYSLTGINPIYSTGTGSMISNYNLVDISDNASAFDDGSLNIVPSLADISNNFTDLSFVEYFNETNYSVKFQKDEQPFVYDGGILLKKFQNYPWTEYTTPDSSAQLVDVITNKITSDYTIGGTSFNSGDYISHIFENESGLSDWLEGSYDVDITNSIATITSSDMPITGTMKYVTNNDNILFKTDNLDISFNKHEIFGQSYNITMNGKEYLVRFVMCGSIGLDIHDPNALTGGDPHVVPLYKEIPIFDLPCKHGSYFQYLVYKKNKETVIVNIMTWMMLLDDSKMKTSNRLLKKFISKPKYYLCYLYISYNNDKTSIKEDICIDLRNMKCVNTSIPNYSTLATNCELPIMKRPDKQLNHIKLTKKHLPFKKILRYKAVNKDHGNITIYTKDSKFEILFGNATENLAFGTYMELTKYPQDILKNGKGVWVNPRVYRHIYDLKSDDKQITGNKLLKNRRVNMV